MLKYNDIIEKLSDKDKIRILCDINLLSDSKYEDLGLPAVRIGSLEEHRGDEYPSPVALANSWDPELVGRVAAVLADRAVADGSTLIKVPGAKPKIDPYRAALSEDAYLASEMSTKYIEAVTAAGSSAAVRGFGLRESDLEWLDSEPCKRFVAEHLEKPYALSTSKGKCAAILTEPDLENEKYKNVNSELKKAVSQGYICDGAAGICEKVSADKTVLHLEHGGLFFEGSAHALESALVKYKRIKNAIEHGTSTTEALEQQVIEGKAISPEMIDEAIDRLFDFVFSINAKAGKPQNAPSDGLAREAVKESIVLLKNKQNILPMQGSTKFCVIGDAAMRRDANGNKLGDVCAAGLIEKGLVYCGSARGYDLDKDRSEELIPRAVNIAETADVVLLFLGAGEHREKRIHKTKKMSIPANQQELLLALSDNKQKIVAVLPPEHTLDVSMPDNCRAILLAPLDTAFCAEALVGVLSGEFSPSGKLASTVYTETHKQYVKRKTDIMRDGLKTGVFIGYRYYDTAGESVEFPFGHGLSYTKFAYSNIKVADGSVSVKVKNTGKLDAAETVQVYVGCHGKGFVRPKKELCSFKKVFIRAGETVTVTLPLNPPTAYDTRIDNFVFEGGEYAVFVGSSVSDIKIGLEVDLNGTDVPQTEEKLTDHIFTRSNIITDNFKLEAKADIMKKSVFNFIAGSASLVLALILKMYCAFAGIGSLFLDAFAVLLSILGIVFFIVEAVRRSKIRSEEKAKAEKAHAAEFNKNAENVGVFAADKMFLKEFDVEEQAVSHEIVDDGDKLDNEQLAYLDKDQTFALAATDFALFAKERGFKLSNETVYRIFASVAASRIIVLTGLDEHDFNVFMLLLANYFHSPAYVDSVNDEYVNADHMLFKTDDYGNRLKTNANLAIESARNATYNAHFVGLTNVKCEGLAAYFTAFMKYVKNPVGCKYIVTLNEKNAETSYYMPHNLWFVMNLARYERVDMLPDFIAEAASVIKVEFEACEGTVDHTHVRDFSYYQIDYLAEKAASKFTVEEDLWKKVDQFEAYVNGKESYHIGNKAWLGLERFAYTYMACGGDKSTALDSALASKIIASVLVTLNGKLGEDDASLSETLDLIFGEERDYVCKEIVKSCEDAIALIKADEEARLAAEEEARVRAEEERLAAEAEAKAREEEERARAEEARLAAEAEAKALEEEARLAAEAEALVLAEEARLAAEAEALARAEEERLAAEAEARARAEEERLAAEARAREEARLAAENEARVREEARQAAEAEAKALEEEAKLASAAVAKAREEQERIIAEAQKREEAARLAAEAAAKAREEQERLAAEATRLAKEWEQANNTPSYSNEGADTNTAQDNGDEL